MAEIDISLNVARLVDEMRHNGGQPNDVFWTRLAAQIALAFKAKRDEVAMLRLSPDGKVISFLFPIMLSKIGTIPLTAIHSLAAKNIREKRAEIVNNFAAYRHASVFEAVDLSEDEKATPIQKIISAPMIVESKVVGVIQISRKARPGEPVGADFGHQDLKALTTLAAILGKYITSLSPLEAVPSKRGKPSA